MDQLTKDFFNNDFVAFNSKIKLTDHVLANNVPVVELKFDLNIENLMPTAVCDQLVLSNNVRPTFPYEFEPRISNWGLEVLWSNGSVVPIVKDVYHKKMTDAIPFKEPIPEALPIKNSLENLGFDVSLCWLSKFEPRGYVRPHRDISLRLHPLTYFWIPINNPAGCEIKIYPYGKVKVNIGSIYLLNQENYTHAVYNNSNDSRYALLGYFDPNIPSALADKVLAAIKEQYQTI